MRLRGLALLAMTLSGCAARPVEKVAAPTIAEWRHGVERLESLRRATEAPRTQRLALDLVEPRTGRHLSARGAVALLPKDMLRMILLGPGGTTAVDLWMKRDAYRLEVPAVGLKKRGDLGAPLAPYNAKRRMLPVDFLGWWLRRPLDGDLVYYAREGAADRYILRDPYASAVVDLLIRDDGSLTARRTTWVGKERVGEDTVSADRIGCGPVRYHQGSTGIDVTVRCEDETPGEPPARALKDPDVEEEP
jgi:hypothetical protein